MRCPCCQRECLGEMSPWYLEARRLLRWSGYTITGAARLLGVSPAYLSRLLDAPTPPRTLVLALGSVLDLPEVEMRALCQAADVRPPRDVHELAEARQHVGSCARRVLAQRVGWTAY